MRFTRGGTEPSLPGKAVMRASLFGICAVALLASGCVGAERKLGRGLVNLTEVARMGELRHSMEQDAIWKSPEEGISTGFVHGVSKTVQRTLIGAYEVLTFPLPSYEPKLQPEFGQFPDNYRPNLLSDSSFATDGTLGFSGGDIAPFLPGSRFRVFDY